MDIQEINTPITTHSYHPPTSADPPPSPACEPHLLPVPFICLGNSPKRPPPPSLPLTPVPLPHTPFKSSVSCCRKGWGWPTAETQQHHR